MSGAISILAPDEPAVHFSTLNAPYGHALSVGPAEPSAMLWSWVSVTGGGPGDAGCPAWFGDADRSALPVDKENADPASPTDVFRPRGCSAVFQPPGPYSRRRRASRGCSAAIPRALSCFPGFRKSGLWLLFGSHGLSRSSASDPAPLNSDQLPSCGMDEGSMGRVCGGVGRLIRISHDYRDVARKTC